MAESTMVLCHKCAGVLAGDREETKGLMGCGCISGYVRGFEPWLTRPQAIQAQIKQCDSWVELFRGQGRPESMIEQVIEQRRKLESL